MLTILHLTLKVTCQKALFQEQPAGLFGQNSTCRPNRHYRVILAEPTVEPIVSIDVSRPNGYVGVTVLV
jgi:hypothetical protein